MANLSRLLSFGFLIINLQFALVTAITALFFAFSGYLHHLGIPPATAGFILSADALAALLVQPLISPLVHSGTARYWLLGGSLLLSSSLLLIGHVVSISLLVIARLMQGTGFICVVTALIALIVRYIPSAMSGRAFGWISLVRLIPYAIIPPLFDLPAAAAYSFPSILHVAALTALFPVLSFLLPSSRLEETTDDFRSPGLSGMKTSLRSRPVQILLLSVLLFFCGYSAVFFFLRQFGSSLGIADPSLFFTVATVMMILIRLLGGCLFDRFDKPTLCAAGLLTAAVCYILLPLCPSRLMFLLLAGFTGLGWGISMPLQAAVMFDVSTPIARAMNQNLLIVMMQGGFFLGPLIGVQLISGHGFTLLFHCLAVTALAAGILMMTVKWNTAYTGAVYDGAPPNDGDPDKSVDARH